MTIPDSDKKTRMKQNAMMLWYQSNANCLQDVDEK